MILQALVGYYQRKAASDADAIAPEGWIRRPVDYFVVLSPEGRCIDIADNASQEGRRRVAKDELVPSIGKQSLKHTNSGKDANLLWDSAAFTLGYGDKGRQKQECFLAELDNWFLDVDDEALTALRSFLRSTREEGLLDELLNRFNLREAFEKREPVIAFRWQPDGAVPIHHRHTLMALYEQKRTRLHEGAVLGNCLVSGDQNVPIVLNETVIKGVREAQTAGANIVSFNKRAFESYGKRERGGENSPIGTSASFAYTTALNQLLRFDSPQKLQVGDATTVFWADHDSSFENDFAAFFDEPRKDAADPDRGTRAVAALLESAKQGVGPVLDNQTRFFVLGLAPNAARISIRFWLIGTVAEMAGRIVRHFNDLEIDHHPDARPYFPIRHLLTAIAVLSDTDNIPPNLSGDVLRAILEGLPYPDTLFSGAVRRIRAEQSKKDKRTGKLVMNVTYVRAAILKACLNRKPHPNEKEITVSLDKDNINPGYRLGRLFAVLERVQEEASPGLNATIRDRYYGAFSATPATVFATLMRMKNHHLAKLENPGRRVNLEKLIGEIVDGLPPAPPAHLSLPDQGRFAIGYYHQRMNRATYTSNPQSTAYIIEETQNG